MAEFCLECWNKINDTDNDDKKYILSKELELCEECGMWKNIIVEERKGNGLRNKKRWLFKRLRKKDL